MSGAGTHREEVAAKVKQIKKAQAKKEMSISIKIQESDLYDWNPSRRFLLDIIARLQVHDEDAFFPEDSPYFEDRIGWCWMSQFTLSLRVGKSEVQVQRDIEQMDQDGVLEVRSWKDSNMADHNEYRVIEKMVEARQRPSQKSAVGRPKRYKQARGANKGSFTTTNQPRRGSNEVAAMDEE